MEIPQRLMGFDGIPQRFDGFDRESGRDRLVLMGFLRDLMGLNGLLYGFFEK
jgi:hypothetical protein